MSVALVKEENLRRRVAGHHDIRMDGMLDLVIRANGMSVLDIGCNRGLVGFEFANNGAKVVHGCDIDHDCIMAARHLFGDLRNCETRFEIVDLKAGPRALDVFGPRQYDIVVMLATYHKIKRVMAAGPLSDLMKHIGQKTDKWFAWRATSDKPLENDAEMQQLDHDLGAVGLKRVHTSRISKELGVAAIWQRA